MDADELASIRDALFQSMDEQRETDLAAAETSSRLGQQQIMYNNDARGTLYSGQPTWERAQLAAETNSNIADIESNYLKNKLSVWDNITDTLDQINSYNKSAESLAKQAAQYNSTAGTVTTTNSGISLSDLYDSLGLTTGDD